METAHKLGPGFKCLYGFVRGKSVSLFVLLFTRRAHIHVQLVEQTDSGLL